MAEGEIKAWVTVNGRRIPIMEGQSKSDAIGKAIGKKSEKETKKEPTAKKSVKEVINKNESDKEKQIAQNEKEAGYGSDFDIKKSIGEKRKVDESRRAFNSDRAARTRAQAEKMFKAADAAKRDMMESEYSKLQAITKKWEAAKKAERDALHKAENRIAKELGIKKNRAGDNNLRQKALRDPMYLKARKESQSLMAKHSEATAKFKEKYRDYTKNGGKSNSDWYRAATEWDDAD